MASEVMVSCRRSGPYHLNTYFLTCRQTRETLVIDPGDHADVLSDHIREKEFLPKALLMTHGHADHFFDPGAFKAQWDLPYCIHGDDEAFFSREDIRAATWSAMRLPPPANADKVLVHGTSIWFGKTFARVIHTPGHTPGSCCVFCENHLFTGDTLFVGEAGRTDLPGGNLDRMIDSIRDRIMVLPPETRICPGHHHPGTAESSTLAREIRENIYITDFILDP